MASRSVLRILCSQRANLAGIGSSKLVAMIPGILHIIRLGQTRDKYDRLIADYQITYNVSSGNSFYRTVRGEEELDEFLSHHAVVPTGERERALAALRDHGNATITGVDIPLKETAPLGMVQDSSDY